MFRAQRVTLTSTRTVVSSAPRIAGAPSLALLCSHPVLVHLAYRRLAPPVQMGSANENVSPRRRLLPGKDPVRHFPLGLRFRFGLLLWREPKDVPHSRHAHDLDVVLGFLVIAERARRDASSRSLRRRQRRRRLGRVPAVAPTPVMHEPWRARVPHSRRRRGRARGRYEPRWETPLPLDLRRRAVLGPCEAVSARTVQKIRRRTYSLRGCEWCCLARP